LIKHLLNCYFATFLGQPLTTTIPTAAVDSASRTTTAPAAAVTKISDQHLHCADQSEARTSDLPGQYQTSQISDTPHYQQQHHVVGQPMPRRENRPAAAAAEHLYSRSPITEHFPARSPVTEHFPVRSPKTEIFDKPWTETAGYSPPTPRSHNRKNCQMLIKCISRKFQFLLKIFSFSIIFCLL
jgi:hypothetical protein